MDPRLASSIVSLATRALGFLCNSSFVIHHLTLLGRCAATTIVVSLSLLSVPRHALLDSRLVKMAIGLISLWRRVGLAHATRDSRDTTRHGQPRSSSACRTSTCLLHRTCRFNAARRLFPVEASCLSCCMLALLMCDPETHHSQLVQEAIVGLDPVGHVAARTIESEAKIALAYASAYHRKPHKPRLTQSKGRTVNQAWSSRVAGLLPHSIRSSIKLPKALQNVARGE